MLFRIAWRDLCQKPVQHALTALMAGVAIALSISVMLMGSSLQQGMTDASMPFDMIVGAKGSPTQLIFNTIFLQDTPIGNIPSGVWDSLATDERASRVIPFAFGDNHKGYRIVGSTKELFNLRPSLQQPSIFKLSEGVFFEGEHQAVIGATVAGTLGLKLGDTFQSTHGLTHGGEEDHHDESFTVVGILSPMNRPYDTGIFVSIETMWEMHGNTDRDVTALMVTPKDYSGLMQLYQTINNGLEAQAAFPGVVMSEVFGMLGQTEDIMRVITWIALAMAVIGMAVSLNWSALSRARENAILRAIGARRRDVLTVVMIEGGLIVLAAAVLGICLGHLTALGVASYMQRTTALYSPVQAIWEECFVVGAVAVFSLLLSLIPSLHAYRADVARSLSPR